jgi:hypothetical protein
MNLWENLSKIQPVVLFSLVSFLSVSFHDNIYEFSIFKKFFVKSRRNARVIFFHNQLLTKNHFNSNQPKIKSNQIKSNPKNQIRKIKSKIKNPCSQKSKINQSKKKQKSNLRIRNQKVRYLI